MAHQEACAQDRHHHAHHRQPDPAKDREPLQAKRHHHVRDRQHRQPQRTGEGLDPFPGVEHRPVPRLELFHHPEVDEPVIGDRPIAVGLRGEHHDRHRHDPHPHQPAHTGVQPPTTSQWCRPNHRLAHRNPSPRSAGRLPRRPANRTIGPCPGTSGIRGIQSIA